LLVDKTRGRSFGSSKIAKEGEMPLVILFITAVVIAVIITSILLLLFARYAEGVTLTLPLLFLFFLAASVSGGIMYGVLPLLFGEPIVISETLTAAIGIGLGGVIAKLILRRRYGQ